MQVTCEKCTAKYNIADDKIKSSGTAVRCPKCQHVFKVFGGAPEGGGGATVACANCGKQTPEVPGQAVVFCGDCQSQLAGDTGGGAAADPFGGGDDPFAGGNIFKDSPAPPPPAPAPAAGGGLFDDAPAGGGGLFDDAPAAPAGGGNLFDDAPAAPTGGGMFDDEPAAPAAGGGLFDDAPAPSAGGGLFDEPASTGGGLFDEPASGGGAAADPFAEFESPPSGGAADPFAEFGDQPDDMGFQDPDEKPRGPLMPATPPAAEEEEAAMPAPVREKAQPTFKKTEASANERAAEFFAEYGAKVGIFGGIGAGLVLVLLVAALALLPATFGARPTRPEDQPGFLASTSFSLQKSLKTKYYGQSMEAAYLQAGVKAMEAWSGVGFAAAEKEYKELLAFDPANEAAKAGLLNLYATWDLVGETTQHEKDIAAHLQAAKATPEARVRALLALGQAREAAAAAAALGERGALYAAFAATRADAAPAPVAAVTAATAPAAAAAVTTPAAAQAATAPAVAAAPAAAMSPAAALEALGAYAKTNAQDFLAQMLHASALRDVGQYGAAVSAYAAAMKIVPGNAKASLEIGKLYYGPLNDGDKAIAALNGALEAAAGGTDLLKAEARYYLSHILQKRGRGPQALDAIQAALAVDGANPRYLTMNGDLLFDSGKVVDAFTSFEKAAKSDPNHVDAYVGIGRANEKLDKVDAALANYKKAIEIDPINMRANFLYAALILKQGRKDEAEKVFTAVLERDPANIEAIAQLARFYEDQERLGDALKEYARIIELAPDKIDGYVGRGAVLLRQNGISEAKEMFGKAAKLEPENPNVLFRLGQAAHLEGDHKTAEASLTTALARDPYHWEAHLYLGMAFAGQGKFEQALVEYQKTIDVNQKAGEAFRQRGLVYLAQSKLPGVDAKAAADLVQKSVAELERALYFTPNSPDLYFDYGNCLDAAGLAGKARDAWIKAKTLRPGFKEAMFALANYYVSFTDYGSAEAVLKDVLKSSPRNAQAYLGMGKVHVAKGNLEEAYRAFSRAGQLDAKDAEAQNLIGEVYDRQGLINQAFTYYQRALRLNPKHGMAHFNLGLYWKDRDKDKAKREFKGALDSGALSREKHEEAQELLKELEYVK